MSQNQDFSYPDLILVRIRDFQAKSGQSQRSWEGSTVCYSHFVRSQGGAIAPPPPFARYGPGLMPCIKQL